MCLQDKPSKCFPWYRSRNVTLSAWFAEKLVFPQGKQVFVILMWFWQAKRIAGSKSPCCRKYCVGNASPKFHCTFSSDPYVCFLDVCFKKWTAKGPWQRCKTWMAFPQVSMSFWYEESHGTRKTCSKRSWFYFLGGGNWHCLVIAHLILRAYSHHQRLQT